MRTSLGELLRQQLAKQASDEQAKILAYRLTFLLRYKWEFDSDWLPMR